MMIPQEHIEIYAKLLAQESFKGLEVSLSDRSTISYHLDEIVWAFTITSYGTLISKTFENGTEVENTSCFGLYPQFKNKNEIIKSFRQHVARKIDIDWR